MILFKEQIFFSHSCLYAYLCGSQDAKSSRKEYIEFGSKPLAVSFRTGNILLPLLVTIISFVKEQNLAHNARSFRVICQYAVFQKCVDTKRLETLYLL